MNRRQIGYRVGMSILLFIGMFYFTYDAQAVWLNCSNALFVVGILYFFPGLLTLTHATEVFQTMGYLGKKVFARDINGGFKSYSAYQTYKDSKRMGQDQGQSGKILMGVGTFYIVLSVLVSYFKCV